MRNAIEVEDLHVVRGGEEVLHGISLSVPGGLVTGLLGPSGCGKTTLMRAIVGVQIVAGGTVEVLGLPAGVPALRSRIARHARERVGYVTQAPSVYGDLTVLENLRYFAAIVDAGPGRVSEVLDAVGLKGRERQLTASLSGGQRARVSLASALLGRPELLVLDEPTVGLDPVLRAELWQMFHRLAAEGTTLLISSHVMDEAAECDQLLLIVPCFLLVLLRYVFDAREQIFQQIGAPLCGLFPFIIMFLVTSITMLRERTTGTLERLMTLPLGKLDLLAGYAIAFGLLAAAQAAIVCLVGFALLGLHAPHGAILIALLAIANALLGMALGLLVSAFARTEFQAVQFMPALIFPQLLLCGLFVPRSAMAPLLEALSWALPLTYAYDALARATRPGALTSALSLDFIAVVGAGLAALMLGALTLRRRTA